MLSLGFLNFRLISQESNLVLSRGFFIFVFVCYFYRVGTIISPVFLCYLYKIGRNVRVCSSRTNECSSCNAFHFRLSDIEIALNNVNFEFITRISQVVEGGSFGLN